MKINTLIVLLVTMAMGLSCQSVKSVSATNINVNSKKTSVISKDNFDIYLLIGQSNMAGRAEIGILDTITLKDAYLFDGKKWEHAKVPLNKYSTTRKQLSYQNMNPGYTFARKLTDYTNKKIGLVVNARGGTSIEQWQKGYTGKDDFDLYEQAVERLLEAKKDGVFKGLIWHQGESNQSSSSTYMPKFKQLVQDLRRDLGQVFFVAGELGKWHDETIPMNSVISNISNNIDQSSYIKSDGLKPINHDLDNPHFDGFSQRVLGGLYADEILKNVYNMSPGVASVYSQCDYKGYKVSLKPGIYNLEELEKRGIHDNDIRSLKIDKGYEVLLFTGQKEGESVLVNTSKDCLSDTTVNEDVSYVIIGEKGKTTALFKSTK